MKLFLCSDGENYIDIDYLDYLNNQFLGKSFHYEDGRSSSYTERVARGSLSVNTQLDVFIGSSRDSIFVSIFLLDDMTLFPSENLFIKLILQDLKS